MESMVNRSLHVLYFGGTTLRITWLGFDSRCRSRTFSSPSRVDGLRGPPSVVSALFSLEYGRLSTTLITHPHHVPT